MDFMGVNSGWCQGLTEELLQVRVSPPWLGKDLSVSVSFQTLGCVPPPEEITDVQSSCRLGGTQVGLIQRSVVGGKVSVP